MLYLNLFNPKGTLPSEASSEADYAFFNYSTHNWIPHFYEAFVKNHEFCGEHMVVLGDLGSKAYSLWYEISKYWGSFENPSVIGEGYYMVDQFLSNPAAGLS